MDPQVADSEEAEMDRDSDMTALENDAVDHGAFIDAQGNEVRITEQMIRQACDFLAAQLPNHHAVAAERTKI